MDLNVRTPLVQHNKQHHRKVLLSSFHLNGHTLIGFQPQTKMLEPPLLVNIFNFNLYRFMVEYLKTSLQLSQPYLYGAPFVNLLFRPNSCCFSIIYK